MSSRAEARWLQGSRNQQPPEDAPERGELAELLPTVSWLLGALECRSWLGVEGDSRCWPGKGDPQPRQ